MTADDPRPAGERELLAALCKIRGDDVSRRQYRTRTEGYGVAVELRVDHAATVTAEELHRALMLAVLEAKAAHAAGGD